jgi:peptidoglycan lytic transglycosylase
MGRFLPFLAVASMILSSCAPIPRSDKLPPAGSFLTEKKWEPGARPYEVNGVRYYPLPDAQGFVEYGKASWYGMEFQGRPTASGQTYDMFGKSAAHRILPLDTMVRVVNLSNNKSIIVPVKDRGPFVKGRVIDLSYGAAKELDMIGPGVVDVKVEALAKEVGQTRYEGATVPVLAWQDFRKGEFTVQVGAFENQDNALKLADRFRKIYSYTNVLVYEDPTGKVLYRVHVSKSETLTEAAAIEKRIEETGFPNAFVVRM